MSILDTIHKVADGSSRMDLYSLWAFILPSKVRLVAVKKSFRLCRDPDDNKFLDCAIAGRARFIVSGDKDLLTLAKVMSVNIVTAKHFLNEF